MADEGNVSFIEAVRRSARRAPGNGIRFFRSATAFEEIDYAHLDADACTRARDLWGRGLVPGDVAILAFEPGIPFVRALMACLYAGVVAAPVSITALRNADTVRRRLRAIAEDSGAKAVLAGAGALEALGVGPSDVPSGASVIVVDGEAEAGAGSWTMPDIDDSSLALLQYTSGSTGVPKGVMVSHGNMLANQRAINGVVGMTSASATVGWLPHYHDMGLIGQILQPIFVGASLYLTSPSQFLRRPIQWLRMVSEYRGTHTVGPDFAFDLCTRLVTDDQLSALDLSSLDAVITGAEPVKAETLQAFTRRFGAAGFRGEAFVPAFGMAETTLLVTGHRGSEPLTAVPASAAGVERDVIVAPVEGERATSLVPCGGPARGFQVAIVDPETARRRDPGGIGEIWVRGASVAQGYWNRPKETQESFRATIDGEPGVHYLRTGDLGAMVDGELVVTGRLKDLIIVRGRNIYPQDLEAAARRLLPPGCLSAAFELPGTQTEVGLVAEVDPRGLEAEGLAALAQTLRKSVVAEFTMPSLGVALVRKGALPRTTSGKVQRSLTRRLLAEQGLPVVQTDGIVGAVA